MDAEHRKIALWVYLIYVNNDNLINRRNNTMKFGVREICDVVIRAKSAQMIGGQAFQKDEPVLYFDTAKTSTVEGAATTVYAQGGKGNSRLIAWEGERTVTFTMEDALISPLGFAILSGAGLIEASAEEAINVHMNETVEATISEGAIVITKETLGVKGTLSTADAYGFILGDNGEIKARLGVGTVDAAGITFSGDKIPTGLTNVIVMVDFYVSMTSGVTQLEVTPDKFAGSYYLEAATLFRRQEDGVDMPAQFIIPNVKIQSAFNFSMAASGDPSTFTFTMDAFPDYTKFDKTKKVLFALQIIDDKAEENAKKYAVRG